MAPDPGLPLPHVQLLLPQLVAAHVKLTQTLCTLLRAALAAPPCFGSPPATVSSPPTSSTPSSCSLAPTPISIFDALPPGPDAGLGSLRPANNEKDCAIVKPATVKDSVEEGDELHDCQAATVKPATIKAMNCMTAKAGWENIIADDDPPLVSFPVVEKARKVQIEFRRPMPKAPKMHIEEFLAVPDDAPILPELAVYMRFKNRVSHHGKDTSVAPEPRASKAIKLKRMQLQFRIAHCDLDSCTEFTPSLSDDLGSLGPVVLHHSRSNDKLKSYSLYIKRKSLQTLLFRWASLALPSTERTSVAAAIAWSV